MVGVDGRNKAEVNCCIGVAAVDASTEYIEDELKFVLLLVLVLVLVL